MELYRAISIPSVTKLRPQKIQQVLVDLINIQIMYGMRTPRVHLELALRQQLRRLLSRDGQRHHLIIIPVQDKNRHVDPLQVLGEIRLGEVPDAVVGRLEARVHALPPPAPDLALAPLGALPVEPEERAGGHVQEELGPVLVHGVPEGVEDGLVETFRVGLCLEQQRGHGSDEHGLLDATGAVLAEEAGDLTSAV